jgi:hypothetical protein
MKPLLEVEHFFEDMGYVRVHVWEETHGEGGSVFMQRPGHGLPNVFVIPFDRSHRVSGFYQLHEHRDYLLAAEILDDPDSSWKPVGREKVSPCATEAHQDYKHKIFDHYVRIEAVAGHGAWAFPISKKEAGRRSPE